MPDVNIKITRVACNTATGTQDITISGFGTPKAALFILNSAQADNIRSPGASLCMGATDGTTQWSMGAFSRSAQANTSVGSRQHTDSCIAPIIAAGVIDGEAIFDSWITDGVRINWTDAPLGAYFLTVILFNGSDLSAKADTINLGTSTSAQTYSSMGFEANVLICGGINSASIDSGISTMAFWTGFVHNDGAGAITQMHQGWTERNNQAAGIPFSRMMTDKFGAGLLVTNGTVSHEYSASSFTSSGFDFTSNASALSARFHFLGLSLGGLNAAVGQYDPPTTATTSTISAAFTPQLTIIGLNLCQAVDTTEGDGDAGAFGLSTISSSEQYVLTCNIQDAAATTKTGSDSRDEAIMLPPDVGSTGDVWIYEGVLTSLDSSGTNLSYSTVEGTTRKWIYLMIESDAVVAASLFYIRRNSIKAMLRR